MPNIWEDIKGDWMLLLKVTHESMKEVGLKITSKVGASFREQVDDSILSKYLMIYINKYFILFLSFVEFSVILLSIFSFF
jgi:hypothetical protein